MIGDSLMVDISTMISFPLSKHIYCINICIAICLISEGKAAEKRAC